MTESVNITQLLTEWSDGDQSALDRLAPVVEHELHRLAARYMAGERGDNVLQPTALVNEAFMRLMNWKDVRWQNRAHFFGVAAQVMRHVLVDLARARRRSKRGGREIHVSLTEAGDLPSQPRDADLEALDEALKRLELLDARQSCVVELRFFGGLTLEEAAEVLGVSVGTVRRDWDLARAWLYRELEGTNTPLSC
jgi:RNA polymerase sigma factor (TIGR02999 family)